MKRIFLILPLLLVNLAAAVEVQNNIKIIPTSSNVTYTVLNQLNFTQIVIESTVFNVSNISSDARGNATLGIMSFSSSNVTFNTSGSRVDFTFSSIDSNLAFFYLSSRYLQTYFSISLTEGELLRTSVNYLPTTTFNYPVHLQNINNNTPLIRFTINTTYASGLNTSSVSIAVNNTHYNYTNLSCSVLSEIYSCNLSITTALADNDGISININASDIYGNLNTTQIAFNLSTKSPSYVASSLGTSNYSSSTGQTVYFWVNWTSTDPLSHVWLMRNTSTAVANITTVSGTMYLANLSYDLSEDDYGTVSFTLYANTTYGNYNYTTTMEINVSDMTAPQLLVYSPVNHSVINNSYFSLVFNVTESHFSECRYKIVKGSAVEREVSLVADDATVLNYTYMYDIQLSAINNSNYNLTINCSDSYNRTALAEYNITISDSTAPAAANGIQYSVSGTTIKYIDLAVTTDEDATCKYSTSDINYSAMTALMSGFGTSHLLELSFTEDTDVTYYVLCSDSIGNIMDTSMSRSLFVDVSESSSSSTEGTSTGSSGGKVTSVSSDGVSVSHQWAFLEKEQNLVMSIDSKDIPFTKISFENKESIKNMEIQVLGLKTAPSSPPEQLTVPIYKYIQITNSYKEGDLNNIVISFRVEKYWLASMKLSEQDIALYHFTNNQWYVLPTTFKSSDADYAYYESETSSFSYFAVGERRAVAKKNSAPEVAPSPTANAVLETDEEAEPAEQVPPPETKIGFEHYVPEKKKIPSSILFIIIGAAITGIVVYLVSTKKTGFSGTKLSEIERFKIDKDLEQHGVHVVHGQLDNVEDFVESSLKKGMSKEEIKAALLEAGWPSEIIDRIFGKL
ncbi:PGF-pre-PGF domain-containing protein [Candidatus Woesearchaeota archaeon]|nr:PGF-pre-PGF domain-containing protein [Candidatus Woesearchaeota archaeon]